MDATPRALNVLFTVRALKPLCIRGNEEFTTTVAAHPTNCIRSRRANGRGPPNPQLNHPLSDKR